MVRVDRCGETELASTYGLADRAHWIGNTVETQFGIASGTKGLTALAVMGLVERERVELGTTARSLLGADLPLIADDVTIEHLLAHRSGIGDYLDEDAVAVSDSVMPVPVHQLTTAEQFVSVLGGHESVFPAGERSGSRGTTRACPSPACTSPRPPSHGHLELVRRRLADHQAARRPVWHLNHAPLRQPSESLAGPKVHECAAGCSACGVPSRKAVRDALT